MLTRRQAVAAQLSPSSGNTCGTSHSAGPTDSQTRSRPHSGPRRMQRTAALAKGLLVQWTVWLRSRRMRIDWFLHYFAKMRVAGSGPIVLAVKSPPSLRDEDQRRVGVGEVEEVLVKGGLTGDQHRGVAALERRRPVVGGSHSIASAALREITRRCRASVGDSGVTVRDGRAAAVRNAL